MIYEVCLVGDPSFLDASLENSEYDWRKTVNAQHCSVLSSRLILSIINKTENGNLLRSVLSQNRFDSVRRDHVST